MERQKIVFNEEKHTYSYKGKPMSGITGIIGKHVGKDFSKAGAFVEPYTEFGKQVHKDIEDYLFHGTYPEHPTSRYAVDWIIERFKFKKVAIYPEVLIGDYDTVATAVDIVIVDEDGWCTLIDTKTGNFDREYCSWQLGINKYLIEIDGDWRVKDTFVLSTKDKFIYRVIPKPIERCKALIANAKKEKK